MTDNGKDSVGGWYVVGETENRPLSAEEAWYAAMDAPELPETAPDEADGKEENARRRRRRTTRIIAICLCAALLISAAGTAIVRARRSQVVRVTTTETLPVPLLPQEEENTYDDYREYFENYYTGSDQVDIERAAADAGVALTLAPQEGAELSLQEIYEKVNPAVVGITSLQDGEEYGWGTGVLFTEDGYIITNTHIIAGCDGARVTVSNGREYDALLIGEDSASDIAVLKIEGRNLPVAEFGESDGLRVGDAVVAIGNPLGEEYAGTMTNGIISAINRNVRNNGHTMTLLQTNAALNEGNSGGPLVNSFGQVVGITNMKIMSVYYSTVEGIGFAIPSSVVKEIADQLIAQGVVSGKPSIGITAAPVNEEAAALYDLPDGVYVASVSEASRSGLVEGDIILEVNGTPVASVAEVNAIKDEFAVGETLTLTVYRDGETITVECVLIDQADVK